MCGTTANGRRDLCARRLRREDRAGPAAGAPRRRPQPRLHRGAVPDRQRPLRGGRGDARLLAAARAARVPTVFTTIAYEPGDEVALAWLRKAPGLAVLAAGSELVELDPRLEVAPDEPVLVKKGASAFFGTDLAERLHALGVDTVVMCGATTSGCVRASVVDAVQHGSRCSSCARRSVTARGRRTTPISSTSREVRRRGLRRRCGLIPFICDLPQRPGRPHEQQLQRVVRRARREALEMCGTTEGETVAVLTQGDERADYARVHGRCDDAGRRRTRSRCPRPRPRSAASTATGRSARHRLPTTDR